MAIPSTQIQTPAPTAVPSILKPPAATDTGLGGGTLNMGIQGPPLSPPTTAGQGASLHQAIQYAKANPSSDYAKRLGGLIVSGKADDRAMKEGVDLSFAGRPSLKSMYQKHIELNGGTPPEAGSPIEHFQQGFLDLINKAGDNTVQQQQEGGKKMLSSITEGADKLTAPENQDTMHQGLTNAETALGTASGAVQTLFAPITGIIQAISDKASDTKAVQDFANGVGPLVDLYDQLDKKINEVAAAHPEAAKNIGDAANVLLATMGGETSAGKGALGGDVGAAGGAVADAGKSAATDIKTAAGDVTNAATAIPGKVGETAKNIIAKPGKVVDATVKNIKRSAGPTFSNVYGLPEDTVKFLVKNPQFATPEALSDASLHNLGKELEAKIGEEKTQLPDIHEINDKIESGLQRKIQTLNEHAKQYSTLGNDEKPGTPRKLVKVEPNWLKAQIENAGVKFEISDSTGKPTGRLEFKSSSDKVHPINVTDTPRGAQVMQNLWDEYGPKFAKGQMSRDTFLKFRQSLAQLANYQGGVDTTLEKVAHGIRDKFNTTYRKQIPGLDKIDAEHSRLSKDFEDSLTGVATEDRSGGMPKIKMNEGAISNIMNADKPTRAKMAARLENIVPGITRDISKLNEFTDRWKDVVDEKGELKGGALHNIKNALNSGRDLRLEQLKTIMPDIENRLRKLKAAEDFHAAATKAGVYGRQGLATTMATAGAIAGNSAVPIVGGILGGGAGWMMGMHAASPEMGLRLLRTFAKHGSKK